VLLQFVAPRLPSAGLQSASWCAHAVDTLLHPGRSCDSGASSLNAHPGPPVPPKLTTVTPVWNGFPTTPDQHTVAHDGTFVYIHSSSTGLYQIGSGQNGSLKSQLYRHLPTLACDEICLTPSIAAWMACAGGALFVRPYNASNLSASLVALIYDTPSLQLLGSLRSPKLAAHYRHICSDGFRLYALRLLDAPLWRHVVDVFSVESQASTAVWEDMIFEPCKSGSIGDRAASFGLQWMATYTLPASFCLFPVERLGQLRPTALAICGRELAPGMKVDAMNPAGTWCRASVRSVAPTRVHVAFEGEVEATEWIDLGSSKIARRGEHTRTYSIDTWYAMWCLDGCGLVVVARVSGMQWPLAIGL